jgi:hypothetical protein
MRLIHAGRAEIIAACTRTPAVGAACQRWRRAQTALSAVCARQHAEGRRGGLPAPPLWHGPAPLPELAAERRDAEAEVWAARPRTLVEAAMRAAVLLTLLADDGLEDGVREPLLASLAVTAHGADAAALDVVGGALVAGIVVALGAVQAVVDAAAGAGLIA